MFTHHDHGLAARSANRPGDTAAASNSQSDTAAASNSQTVIVCA